MPTEDNSKPTTRTVLVVECTDSYSHGSVPHKALSAIMTHCSMQVTDDEYNALVRYAESTKYYDRWVAVLEIKQPQDVAAMIKAGKDIIAAEEEIERRRTEERAAYHAAQELKAKHRKEKRQKAKEEIAMLRRLHLQHAQDNASAVAE